MDKEIDRFIEDHKIPDDVKEKLKSEKSSTKRAVMLPLMVRELEEKKATSGKGEKDTLQAEINRLNGELRQTKESISGLTDTHNKEKAQIRKDYALGTLLGGYKTIYDNLPSDVKLITLNALINKSLSADSAELIVDEHNNLSIKKKDGSNFFGENNLQYNPSTYLDKIFSRDKVLVVNDQNNQQQQQNNNNNGSGANNSQFYRNQNGQQNQNNHRNNNGSGGNNNAVVNTTLKSLVSNSLKDLENSEKQTF